MELVDIADILNDELLVNAIGATVTVDEQLSNIADYGKTITNATKTDFLDFYGLFVAGVIDYNFGLRVYEPTTLGIYKTTDDFIGVKERIKTRSLLDAVSSPVGKLVDGTSYIDGKFHGYDFSNLIYTKWDSFRLIYSIEEEDAQMKQRFSSIEGVTGLVAEIQNRFKSSLNAQRYELEKRVLLGGIANAYNDGREVKLLTMYNDEFDTELTVADAMHNKDFKNYALNVISDVMNAMTEGINEIYNDGSVITYTPKEELRFVVLSTWANACKYGLYSSTYHDEYVTMKNYTEVPFWQNRGKSLAPRLGLTGTTISEIHTTDGATEDPTIVDIDNVIACVYDNDALSFNSKVLSPVIEPVYGGRFNNYIHDEEIEMMVDPRASMVIFTLN